MNRKIIQQITPPLLWKVIKHLFPTREVAIWIGNYLSWEEAKMQCSGYDDQIILEKCKESLLKVKNSEAVYERDSAIFNEVQYSWGLLAGLQRAALENNTKLCVLDFGGSLGSSYYQNKDFLNLGENLIWCIVEQEHFVKCGRENFESEQLKFYYSIEECLSQQQPNVLLLSSVLQYLENPYEWISKFVNINIPYIIIDRTAYCDKEADLLTIQNVPGSIYKASYPAWFFSKSMNTHALKDYKIVAEFDSGYTPRMVINQRDTVYWSGLILKK
jgi:putative methyltransferase (TIGR04325 family)